MNLVISIIIPVYKVEEYINRCIQSIINQTYTGIEIILVDDGSPDNCPELCDSYAKEDLRIKVIHKSNGGLSDARNAGLRVANGEYVLFVDSDDYIDLDTCERFVNIIEVASDKPDIIVGNARRIEEKEVKDMIHTFKSNTIIITGKEYLKRELRSNTMFMVAWLNLYNREFLISNNLYFKYGLIHEDEQFTPRVFLKANTVIGTDIIFYNYLIREGSITTQKNKIRNAEHLFGTIKELELIYNKIEDKELKTLLLDNLVGKHLNIFQVAGLHKKKYAYLLDGNFLKKNVYTSKNKKKVLLWRLSKKLYYCVNKLQKCVMKF